MHDKDKSELEERLKSNVHTTFLYHVVISKPINKIFMINLTHWEKKTARLPVLGTSVIRVLELTFDEYLRFRFVIQ